MAQQRQDGALPAAIIAAAVIAFVAYVSFQGSSHAVDFAVTDSDVEVVPGGSPRLPGGWQRRAGSGHVMLLDVSWQAGDSIPAGSYAVLVSAPPGWLHLGCRPACEWVVDEGLRQFGRRLPRPPYPLAATFDAEQFGHATVAYRLPPAQEPPEELSVAAWLLQTSGDDVLGAEQITLG